MADRSSRRQHPPPAATARSEHDRRASHPPPPMEETESGLRSAVGGIITCRSSERAPGTTTNPGCPGIEKPPGASDGDASPQQRLSTRTPPAGPRPPLNSHGVLTGEKSYTSDRSTGSVRNLLRGLLARGTSSVCRCRYRLRLLRLLPLCRGAATHVHQRSILQRRAGDAPCWPPVAPSRAPKKLLPSELILLLCSPVHRRLL